MKFYHQAAVLILISFCTAFLEISAQENPLRFTIDEQHVRFSFVNHQKAPSFGLSAILPQTSYNDRPAIIKEGTDRIKHIRYPSYFGNNAQVTEIFQLTDYGIDWTIEIKGSGSAWSVPIETRLDWESSTGLRFWTTWPDNQEKETIDSWQDPLLTAGFKKMNLVYGGESHWSRNSFSIPIATTFLPDYQTGLSFILSPADTILGLELVTNDSGQVAFRHLQHRIDEQYTIRFHHHIVVHPADWRAGLGWMEKKFGEYFFPKEPTANEIAGNAAYSAYEGELDTAYFNRMGFRVNWKASLDFPYMGLFIPPTNNNDSLWEKYRQRGVQVGDGMASANRLQQYSKKFRDKGYFTLSYFNITEFGNKIVYPYHGPTLMPNDWSDANDAVYHKLSSALLKPAGVLPDWDERPVFSNWEDCVVMDPGDSTYLAFLLDQARLHLEKIPASAGICIDRLDWLRYFNQKRDDGISMVDGRPVQSMILSWNQAMKKIGPVMHGKNKVIFCNPLYKRIDLMKEVDGVYDEYGNYSHSLNLSAFLALKKPLIAWTVSRDDFRPNPDAYFQQHLYLGSFLTVPFPGNDHTILPDSAIEKYYLDYGPMLNVLRGREWVLEPNIIRVVGEKAKANIFKVGKKLVIPVIYGEDKPSVDIVLSIPRTFLEGKLWNMKILYPGESLPVKGRSKKYQSEASLNIPLKRGCALVILE